jgi:hypothetical protein
METQATAEIIPARPRPKGAWMNDDLPTLFEPEAILSMQMSWGARSDGDTSSARALMLAILEDAVRCIERGRRRRHARTRAEAADAEGWIRSDARAWLFSFATICDVLGFDPDALRGRVLTNSECSMGAQTSRPSPCGGERARARLG